MSLPNFGNVFPDDILGRIRDLEDRINQLTGGTFGKVTVAGDVTGLSDDTTVERLQGSAVSSAAPSSGQVLEWDGSAWTPTAPDSVPDWNLFGDGSDGDETISTTVTLTQDKFYDDLTVTSSGILKAGGYRIYVKGTLTVDSGGVISHDGQSATTRTGASGASGGSDSGKFNGGDGANGGNFGNGSNATTTTGNWSGGSGGNGGAGGGNNGGTGATVTPISVRRPRSTYSIINADSFQVGYGTYQAGGGGGGGAGPSGPNGGGGGGGGGVLHICARTLINDGTLRALGGNGANGQGGDGGGGGGGGGGVIFLSYKTKSGTGTVSVAGGTKGNGVGTGSAGVDGSTGTIYELALT